MNETMSLLIATTILATGGLGLYMYKSSDDNERDDNNYDEDMLFNSTNDQDLDNGNDLEEDYIPKNHSRNSKTKRRRKQSGTKRRY